MASVYASGYRIKVAVIAARSDLGAIPSLFGKQSAYAGFLGQELSSLYVGPLLVAMPSGYGIYDGGRSVAAEQSVLARLAAPASSRPDGLVAAATTAAADLLAARALASKDVLKPYLNSYGGRYEAGKLTIRFYVYDDSGRAALSATVKRAGRILFSGGIPSARSSYTSSDADVHNPRRLPRGRARVSLRRRHGRTP